MMKKRSIISLLLLILILSVFTGCSKIVAAPALEAPETPMENSTPAPQQPVEEEVEVVVEAPKKPKIYVKEELRSTEIPFKVIEKEDARTLKGETRVIQEGVPGFLSESYYVTYEDRVNIKEELKSSVVEFEPIDEIIGIGTRVDKAMNYIPTKNKSYYENEELAQSIFKNINAVRTENGLNALIWKEELANSAHAQAVVNYENFTFEHSIGGPAENLFYCIDYLNYPEMSKYSVDMWMNSTAHRENILDPSYEFTGVDVIIAEQYFPNGGWIKVLYASQHFLP